MRSAPIHRPVPRILALLLAFPAAAGAQRAGFPALIESNQTDVLVSTMASLGTDAAHRRLAGLIQGCRKRIMVSSTDSASLLAAMPLPTSVPAKDALVFSVLPDQARLVDCGDDRTQSTLAAARGFRVTEDTAYIPDRDIMMVIVRRGTEILHPLDERRAKVQRLGPAGLRTAEGAWVRLVFDAELFAPDASGIVPDLSLEVRTAAGGIAEHVPLPWEVVRRVWETAIAARSEGVTMAALLETEAARAERRRARALGGVELLAAGDVTSARVVLGALVDEEPCFTLAASSPEAARATTEALSRRATRCTPQRPLLTVGRALVLPGFGRSGDDDAVLRRAAVAAGTFGLAAVAISNGSSANDLYAKYLSVQAILPAAGDPDIDVDTRYKKAETARTRANVLGAVAAALWGTQALRALWKERRFARELRDVQHYDVSARRRAVGLTPLLEGRAIGLSLRYTW